MEDRSVTKTKMLLAFLVLYASTTCSQCDAAGTISASQTVRYNETIVSPQETFELGFFSPGNSRTIMSEFGTRKYQSKP
ncbi:hypothetical protein HanHA300_Chr11g0392091 [Helianthus annuus]|nr:hypothetical protein HanHA300_Chr11g0392091 [Helianthus annuus]